MLNSWFAKLRLKRLIQSWVGYRNIVLESFATDDPPPSLQESFLRVEAYIATQLQHLADAVPASAKREAVGQIGEMTELLKHHVTPKNRRPGELWDRQEFELTWHRHYIFLNELKGVALGGNHAAARGPASLPGGGARRSIAIRNLVRRGSRLIVLGAAACVLLYVVASGLGISRAPGGRFAVESPTSVGAAIQNGLNALQGLTSWLGGFLAPILQTYGPLGTILLVGALFLCLAYWSFLRG